MTDTEHHQKRKGLKQAEFKNCVLCGKGMMHSGNPSFYRVQIEHFLINVEAVTKQHGLEMSMGKAAPLAAIMGPDEDLATRIIKSRMLICANCALDKSQPVLALHVEDDAEKTA